MVNTQELETVAQGMVAKGKGRKYGNYQATL
jgi:hypothetical protein